MSDDTQAYKVTPLNPTDVMNDEGAQRIASFEDGSVWPDSWDRLQVIQMRNIAERVWRSMWSAAVEDAGQDEMVEALKQRWSFPKQLTEAAGLRIKQLTEQRDNALIKQEGAEKRLNEALDDMAKLEDENNELINDLARMRDSSMANYAQIKRLRAAIDELECYKNAWTTFVMDVEFLLEEPERCIDHLKYLRNSLDSAYVELPGETTTDSEALRDE